MNKTTILAEMRNEALTELALCNKTPIEILEKFAIDILKSVEEKCEEMKLNSSSGNLLVKGHNQALTNLKSSIKSLYL